MSDYSHVPRAVFDTDLDTVTLAQTKGLVQDPTGLLGRKYRRLPESLSDLLMIAPKLTFKVTGANVPLAVLIQIFGASAVEGLLADGCLEFILWREQITVVQTPIDGLIPFAPLSLDDPVSADPEASNATGLLAASSLNDRQRQRFTQLATERTSLTDAHGAKEAWQALVDAHKAGDLEKYGVPAELPLSKMDDGIKRRLGLELASLHQAAEIVERELDFHEAPETWETMMLLAQEVNSSPKTVMVTEDVLNEERVPSAGKLVARKVLNPRDVIRLRATPEAEAFRKWLWTRRDPADATEVIRDYRKVIAGDQKDLRKKTWWYRYVRILGMQGLGTAADYVAGGGILGFVASTALPIADELLQAMKENRSPRRLSRKLREVSEEAGSL